MRLTAAIALAVLFAGLLGAATPARADTPPESNEPQTERWSADPRLWRALIEWRQRLRLELASSRDLCTAGTLTEISWQIAGGKPPYSLQIEGSPVAADADSTRINCGPLTEAEAADEEAELAAKRITAVVTDSRGVRREAAIDVARARALPAPTKLHAQPKVGLVLPYWRGVWAAGSQFPPEERNSNGNPWGPYLVRYREVGETAWRYDRYDTVDDDWQHPGRAIFEMQVASLLHPLELATPAALNWSETLRYAEHRAPENVTATATHDTVTVSWDRQPYGGQGFVTVSQSDGASLSRQFLETEDSGRWEVQFSHLPADTAYEVTVRMSADRSNPSTTVSVRTQPASPNAKPLPRGPKNLTATATHDRITISWDAPFEGAEPRYLLQIFEADTNRAVDWTWPYQAPFEYTARGRIGRLQPDTTYRIDVIHRAIPKGKASIEITTQPEPDGSAQAAGTAGTPDPWGAWSAPGSYRLNGLPERLTLELESSRDLCTAGTLTEISWEISGGTAPYALTVEGSAVNINADNTRINCGALTEAEAANEDAELTVKRINAVVTDSRGVRREAAIEVARARALPVPTGTYAVTATPGAMMFDWLGARGPKPCDVEAEFGMRWRRVGETAWGFLLAQSGHHQNCDVWTRVEGLQEGASYEAAIAALRDPIELETPAVLQWTSVARGATSTWPTGLTATVTHDTVTVQWDRQPSVHWYKVSLSGPNGSTHHTISSYQPPDVWGDPATGVHQVVFRHLPADTSYTVRVSIDTGSTEFAVDRSVSTETRTTSAPSGWRQLSRGPQNLRATATTNSITVSWNGPFAEADSDYRVTVYHPQYPQSAVVRYVSGTSFSLAELESGVTYRVRVEHRDIVVSSKDILVTTTMSPQTNDGVALDRCCAGYPVPGDGHTHRPRRRTSDNRHHDTAGIGRCSINAVRCLVWRIAVIAQLLSDRACRSRITLHNDGRSVSAAE